MRAQLERAATLSTKTEAQSKEPVGPFGFLADQYQGGKKGYGFERQDDFSVTLSVMLLFEAED